MPSMPRLDQPPAGDRHTGVQQAAMASAHQPMSPDQYQQAVESGQATPGVGAAYPANQPNQQTASGEDGAPLNPPRPEGGLRPETKQQLEEMAEASAKEEEEKRRKEEEDEEFFASLGEATNDILNNKERRLAIEEKITDELSFDDLMDHQELRQKVPIRKGFVPEYRTCSADEDLEIKRLISDERGSERYILDKFTLMGLCCGLFSINNKPLPSHLDKDGTFNESMFKAKMSALLRYPLVIVADLSANYVWFQRRVQKLLSVDEVRSF